MSQKIVQTAGRTVLGDFSPMFAHLNDDILFGEVWNEEALPVKTKCIITVVALMAQGITDSSLQHHLQNAKNNGVTKEEKLTGENTVWLDAKRISNGSSTEEIRAWAESLNLGKD